MIMKEMCERPNHPCGWAGKPRANGGRPPQIPGFGITNFLVGRVAKGRGVIKGENNAEMQHSHSYSLIFFLKRREKP